MSEAASLRVRKFPAEVRQWAKRRGMNMSEETRRMWAERIRCEDAGTAALRSKLAEKRAALDGVEERAEELREEIAGLESTLDVMDPTPDELNAALREKPLLVHDTDAPAVRDLAATYVVTPETVIERHAEIHDTEENNASAAAD